MADNVGRWTINEMRLGLGWNANIGGPIIDDLPVPVVPCDDAAVERVMAVLDDGRVFPGDESNITPDELRKLAEAALRAAGDAP